LEAESRGRIVPGDTLVIFDEIQSCSRALTSLKYFNEQTPEYCIIGAGSLLGVAINREEYSFRRAHRELCGASAPKQPPRIILLDERGNGGA
jgi:predicted AAA+ superfamily ATPase